MPVTDFGDVAARIAAGLAGIRACLVVSRDGLSLGAYPADGEGKGREVWDMLEQLGDLKRGFVEMGMELWVIARRGPYGAVVVASPDVKPGLVLDRIEANLIAAEQERSRQTTDEPLPPPRPEPVRRPRSPLHPEPRLEQVEQDSDQDAEPAAAPEHIMAEPEPTEAVDAVAQDTTPEVEAPASPVVDLSRVPDLEPVPEDDEAVPEPPTPLPPAPPAPEPVGEPAAQAFALAMESDPGAAEDVPTFTPAVTPEPAVGEVYVAGVAPEEAPPPEPVPTPEPPPVVEEPAPKKKRRLRKKSGEVDRVALAREFGHLMRDEFGV